MPTIQVDDYVVDTLMADLVGHDRQPSAFLVYLFLWRHTHGCDEETAQVSLFDLATGTGLSKRAVQEALRWLSRRRLLAMQREGITAIPVYTVRRPWAREVGDPDIRARLPNGRNGETGSESNFINCRRSCIVWLQTLRVRSPIVFVRMMKFDSDPVCQASRLECSPHIVSNPTVCPPSICRQ